MLRATIHQVLDKAWIEVEHHEELHGTFRWVSVGRVMLGDAEEIVSVSDATIELENGLSLLRVELRKSWDMLEA